MFLSQFYRTCIFQLLKNYEERTSQRKLISLTEKEYVIIKAGSKKLKRLKTNITSALFEKL